MSPKPQTFIFCIAFNLTKCISTLPFLKRRQLCLAECTPGCLQSSNASETCNLCVIIIITVVAAAGSRQHNENIRAERHTEQRELYTNTYDATIEQQAAIAIMATTKSKHQQNSWQLFST
ncbi:unnamed protein product [Ceratitis capitata]|uniref:(Mediterranean fruit fly) hypothetical protein n=1 Tax=Ceratitis capitata TaxID=7213 RepID=A0A811VF12_CERCA|nr:unnamed protein product [Ceratitis capitata]